MGDRLVRGLLVAVVAYAGPAHATQAPFDNAVPGLGHVDVDLDDFGFYGRQTSMMTDDNYWPAGETKATSSTFMAGIFLFVTTPGPVTSGVVLTDWQKFWSFAEPGPMTDGITGNHTALTRTVITANAGSGMLTTSAFRIADAPSQLQLDVTLRQELMAQPVPKALLLQTYTITNTGGVTVDLVLYAFTDADLYYNQDSSWTNDVVGVGPGLCYVYEHQPNMPQQGVALRDGGGTIKNSYYVGVKAGYVPDPSGPPMAGANANGPEQYIFNSWSTPTPGMPSTWRNYIPVVGYNMAGEDTTGFDGDASIGLEYHLTLAPGQTETIKLERWYGTNQLPCATSVSCGNGVIDPGEACDSSGVDSATCNAATCTMSSCGDGVLNAAADEQCESRGIDSPTCNGATCTTAACGDGYVNRAAGETCDDGKDTESCNAQNCQPPACGDGIVNVAAGEDCEAGSLCDLPTCKYNFSIGGGCAGCTAEGGPGGWWLLVGVGLWSMRRRSRRR